MNQASIKKILQEQELNYKKISEGYKSDEEYSEVINELKSLRDKIAILENKKYLIQRNYAEENKEEIEFAKQEIKYSQQLLNDAKNGLDPKEYNESLERMFKAFYAGTTWSDKTLLQWVSEDGQYAIFKKIAHQAYLNRGESCHSEAIWCLFKISDEFSGYNGNSTTTLKQGSEFCLFSIEGGRWNKERQKEVESVIEKDMNQEK